MFGKTYDFKIVVQTARGAEEMAVLLRPRSERMRFSLTEASTVTVAT